MHSACYGRSLSSKINYESLLLSKVSMKFSRDDYEASTRELRALVARQQELRSPKSASGAGALSAQSRREAERLSSTVSEKETLLLDALRTAGLKPGEENALVQQVRELARCRRRCEAAYAREVDAAHAHGAQKVHAAMAQLDELRAEHAAATQRNEALREKAVDAFRKKASAHVKSLRGDFLEEQKVEEARRTKAEEEWKAALLARLQRECDERVSEARGTLEAQHRTHTEATIEDLAKEYHNIVGECTLKLQHHKERADRLEREIERERADRQRSEERERAELQRVAQLREEMAALTAERFTLRAERDAWVRERDEIDRAHSEEWEELQRKHDEQLEVLEAGVRRAMRAKDAKIAGLRQKVATSMRYAVDLDELAGGSGSVRR